MVKPHALAPILIAVLFAGCQGGELSPPIEERSHEISGSAETAIAGDMANRFIEVMGKEKPQPLYLSRTAQPSAEALESALKLWGYPFVDKGKQAQGKPAAVEVTYGTAVFEDIVLVRLSTPELTLTRAYRTNATGAQPATPLAITRHP